MTDKKVGNKPKKEAIPPTSLRLSQDMAGALCYVFPWISGAVMLLLERKNSTVKFHALQSIMVALPFMIVRNLSLPLFGDFGPIIHDLFRGLMILTFVLLAGSTLMGKKIKVPKIGDFCEERIDILN
ncbi:hypothetical protein H8D30_00725 [bacterium]|nr:hypothetical protein [bacterium]